MEQTKFKLIVDTLLEAQPKDYIKKSRELQHRESADYLETSLKLTPRVEQQCGDCGKQVINRRVEFYVTGLGTKRRQWKKHCVTCKTKTKISFSDINNNK